MNKDNDYKQECLIFKSTKNDGANVAKRTPQTLFDLLISGSTKVKFNILLPLYYQPKQQIASQMQS